MFIKEITLCHKNRYAIVIDQDGNQWFCEKARNENESVNHYLASVLLDFFTSRTELFNCDVA